MKIEITEFVEETFTVEVEDGLEGDALESAIEDARVQYEGDRCIAVTSVDWEETE